MAACVAVKFEAGKGAGPRRHGRSGGPEAARGDEAAAGDLRSYPLLPDMHLSDLDSWPAASQCRRLGSAEGASRFAKMSRNGHARLHFSKSNRSLQNVIRSGAA